MKRDSGMPEDDEINLSEIITKLWNEKILIISISLIFMIAGYAYSTLQTKIYITEIILREAPSSLFEVYRPLFKQQQQQQQQQQQIDTARKFNDEFSLNLSSYDSLFQFVEQNNTIDDFKNHLKEKNISVEKYFQPQLGTRKFKPVIDKKNNIPNKYSLTYSSPLPGESFLNNYIIFVQQQTIKSFKKQLEKSILNQITIHQQNLEIANKIDLANPILQSMGAVNEPDALFYKGSKVLTQQITYLNMLLNETKNLTLDYNPILEQASSGSLITMPPKTHVVIFFLLGLFFSVMLVFLRPTLHRLIKFNKNYKKKS
jgi:LPS O-antigen subunit length determinant protein (WzzB/FepE family)